MRFIAPLAGLVLAVSAVAASAQTPPAAPQMTAAGTPKRSEVHIARPIEMTISQQAAGMTYDGKTVTLTGISPLTSFTVDRPERIAGSMTPEQFVKLWNATVEMVRNDPPNAALTLLGANLTQVIVKLGSVTQNGTSLTFQAKLMDGDLPASGGPANLVTAPTIYRPLADTSSFLKCWWSPYWLQRVCRAAW